MVILPAGKQASSSSACARVVDDEAADGAYVKSPYASSTSSRTSLDVASVAGSGDAQRVIVAGAVDLAEHHQDSAPRSTASWMSGCRQDAVARAVELALL